jgi:hypothetical protein
MRPTDNHVAVYVFQDGTTIEASRSTPTGLSIDTPVGRKRVYRTSQGRPYISHKGKVGYPCVEYTPKPHVDFNCPIKVSFVADLLEDSEEIEISGEERLFRYAHCETLSVNANGVPQFYLAELYDWEMARRGCKRRAIRRDDAAYTDMSRFPMEEVLILADKGMPCAKRFISERDYEIDRDVKVVFGYDSLEQLCNQQAGLGCTKSNWLVPKCQISNPRHMQIADAYDARQMLRGRSCRAIRIPDETSEVFSSFLLDPYEVTILEDAVMDALCQKHCGYADVLTMTDDYTYTPSFCVGDPEQAMLYKYICESGLYSDISVECIHTFQLPIQDEDLKKLNKALSLISAGFQVRPLSSISEIEELFDCGTKFIIDAYNSKTGKWESFGGYEEIENLKLGLEQALITESTGEPGEPGAALTWNIIEFLMSSIEYPVHEKAGFDSITEMALELDGEVTPEDFGIVPPEIRDEFIVNFLCLGDYLKSKW